MSKYQAVEDLTGESYSALCSFAGDGAALRIMLCVNACEGVSTAALQAMPGSFGQVLSEGLLAALGQRDQLLAALHKISANAAENPEWIRAVADDAIAATGGEA